MEENMIGKRQPLKTLNYHKLDKNTHHHLSWKQKLRESCCKRVREDRNKLLWELRSPHHQPCVEKELIKSAFQDIVSDEFKKIKKQQSCTPDVLCSLSEKDDDIWDYDGQHTADQSEHEEILLEMQRIFYEDMRLEQNERDTERSLVLEDEEDEYLASALQEYMQLNDEKAWKEQIWCPVCKKGKLNENHDVICCSLCHIKLNRGDEVNLALLKNRLAEAHEEHFDKGCRSTPDFCVETKFDLSALYLLCQKCNMFEIVI